MDEYIEMLRKDEDQQLKSIHIPLHESGKSINLISSYFTNKSIEDMQELDEETCFDKLLEDEDDFCLTTTQVEKILSSLEAFNSDQDLKDFDMLLDESASYWVEDDAIGSSNSFTKQPISFMEDLKRVDTSYSLFDFINKFCVYSFRPELAFEIYRATRKWHDASVKLRKTLVKSNDELFIDEYNLMINL